MTKNPIHESIDRTAAYAEGALEGAEGTEGLAHAVHGAIDNADDAIQSVRGRTGRPSRTAQRLHKAVDKVGQATKQAQRSSQEMVADVKQKAHAVAETTQRAVEAPPRVAKSLQESVSAWFGGVVAGLGLMAAAGLLGIVLLVTLTVELTRGLDRAWGVPWGGLFVCALYLVGAIACWVAGQARQRRGREEAARHMGEAQEELRRVARPVKRAFHGERQ